MKKINVMDIYDLGVSYDENINYKGIRSRAFILYKNLNKDIKNKMIKEYSNILFITACPKFGEYFTDYNQKLDVIVVLPKTRKYLKIKDCEILNA